MSVFNKAAKAQSKLRLGIQGPSGAGKTFTALSIASQFGKVAVGDTEYGSASKYADQFNFDVCPLTEPYHPEKIGRLIKEAATDGFDILVIDSLTHFWNSEGGFLSLVDQEAKKAQARGGKYDSFGAWKVVDPVYQKMIQQILSAPIHIIVTVRAKTEHVIEENASGRKTVKKLGMAGEMRDNFVYNLDIEGMLTMDHALIVGKTRCPAIDGKVFEKPGAEFAETVKTWLNGTEPKPNA